MKTTLCLAIALAAGSDAFMGQPAFFTHTTTSTSLASHYAPSYTGGPDGSRMVSYGQLDKDAPWGNENPNLLFDQAGYRRPPEKFGPVPFGPEHDPPASTGGAGGSTFVSNFIYKESMFATNYHLAQQYQSHLRLSQQGLGDSEPEYRSHRLSSATQNLGPLDPRQKFSTIPKPQTSRIQVPAQTIRERELQGVR